MRNPRNGYRCAGRRLPSAMIWSGQLLLAAMLGLVAYTNAQAQNSAGDAPAADTGTPTVTVTQTPVAPPETPTTDQTPTDGQGTVPLDQPTGGGDAGAQGGTQGGDQNGDGVPDQLTVPVDAGHVARFEINFLEDFASHHLFAAELSELCATRATRAEVVDLCTTIGADQREEIGQMQEWLQDWYDEDLQPALSEHERQELAQFATLTGEQFERRYLMRMTGHHAIGLQHAAECLARAAHEELVDFCGATAQTQAEQLGQIRDWLAEFYGVEALDMRKAAVIAVAAAPDGDDDVAGGGNGTGTGNGGLIQLTE